MLLLLINVIIKPLYIYVSRIGPISGHMTLTIAMFPSTTPKIYLNVIIIYINVIIIYLNVIIIYINVIIIYLNVIIIYINVIIIKMLLLFI